MQLQLEATIECKYIPVNADWQLCIQLYYTVLLVRTRDMESNQTFN